MSGKMYHASWRRKTNHYVTQAITFDYATIVLLREFDNPNSHNVYFTECGGSPCKCVLTQNLAGLNMKKVDHPRIEGSSYHFSVYCFYRRGDDEEALKEMRDFIWET